MQTVQTAPKVQTRNAAPQKPASKYNDYFRSQGEQTTIATLDGVDLLNETNPVSFRFVSPKVDGIRRLHMVMADNRYISIKLKNVAEYDETPEGIVSILTDNVLYTGVNDAGTPWITAAQQGELPATTSIAASAVVALLK